MTTTATEARTIDPATLRSWIERGEAVVIDVREPDEHAAERIAGARLVPLSKFDAARVPGENGKRLVLHCKSGRRAAEAIARLDAAGRAGGLSLAGGIDAWKAAGLPVERAAGRVPIPIIRQVQITAGSIVFVGTLLGAFLDRWFLVLPAFIGAGLVFAGVSGTCGMAAMLRFMPWNKALRAAC